MSDPIGHAIEEGVRLHAGDVRGFVRFLLLQTHLPMSRRRVIELELTKHCCDYRTMGGGGLYLYCVSTAQHHGAHHNPQAKTGCAWSR